MNSCELASVIFKHLSCTIDKPLVYFFFIVTYNYSGFVMLLVVALMNVQDS